MNLITNTDIIVIGGGAAGISAAVAASKSNQKVVLIEQNGFLGGKATAAQVGTICGLYKFSKNKTPEYIVNGFVKDFAENLQAVSDSKPLHSAEGLHYLPYNIDAFKNIAVELLYKSNVKVYRNCKVISVEVQETSIKTICFENENGISKISFKAIVDCSGDSIISQLVNIDIIKSKKYQAAAQVFTMQGVDEKNEARLSFILMKSLSSAIEKKLLPHFFDRIYVVQGSLKNNCVSLKIGIPKAVTFSNNNIKQLEKSAAEIIEKLSEFLIINVTCFKNAKVLSIAPEVGIRVGVRSLGKYILSENDVLTCRKFDTAIANGSWPIEEWDLHKRVNMRYFEINNFYQIPADCLQSNTIKNLFFAGRNISATTGAIASARVIGVCMQTGYAAGSIAAAFAECGFIDVAIKLIKQTQLLKVQK
ncbi:MAG: FAD-dependent oxidoreductase [Ferruginibacter sp.]|nr:FAD-dependent oxidoreductase [Ferruginibacter sp.]